MFEDARPFRERDEFGKGEEYELKAADGPPLYDANQPSDAKIIDWRLGVFGRMGFDVVNALAMSLRRDVDSEYVGRLLERGASHELVLSIVL